MTIPIDNLIRTRRKTISLIIQSDGKLTVRAPIRISDFQIREFIQTHENWILKNQARVKATPPPQVNLYLDGELFLFLGKKYQLNIVSQQRPALIFRNSRFLLSVSSLQGAHKEFTRWYIAQARNIISKRVGLISGQYNFKYKKIRISSAHTRWGSCSSNGTLSFTWRLIMAPIEIVDYVVLHELVHTRVKNHSKKFWLELEKVLPTFRKQVRWLKENGKYLSISE